MKTNRRLASFFRHNARRSARLDTTTLRERLVNRNAGFIRQRDESHGPLPDKSGVPVVVYPVTFLLSKLPRLG